VAALRAELPAATISYTPGCAVRDADRSGFAHAAAHAREADVVVAVLGDEAGLFGRATSGEGCDVADLRLPGVQEDLLRVLVAAGTPVVLVLVTGRPYAIGQLDPGQARRVTFRLHADRTAFSGRTGTRVVEPGEIRVAIGGASDQLPLQGSFTLRGPERAVGADRVLDTQVLISDD
jgi:beta-xylosidase